MSDFEPVGISKTTSLFPKRVMDALKELFPVTSNVFTKEQADARFEGKNVAYDKESSDAHFAAKADTFTKTESNAAHKVLSDDILALSNAMNKNVRSGTAAARPAANTVPNNTLYAATDVPEVYLSVNNSWLLIGGAGGELGYASYTGAMINYAQEFPNRYVIPGASVTFTAGDRPVMIKGEARIANATPNKHGSLYLVLDGTMRQRLDTGPLSVADRWSTVYGETRITGLAKGSQHIARLEYGNAEGSGADTVRLGASPTEPVFIQVVSV